MNPIFLVRISLFSPAIFEPWDATEQSSSVGPLGHIYGIFKGNLAKSQMSLDKAQRICFTFLRQVKSMKNLSNFFFYFYFFFGSGHP